MPQQEPVIAKASQTRDSMARALLGRVLGDFELRREIGRGGMGTVFEAWQLSLKRFVAVKVLANSQGLTEMAIERFQREAQAAAKLHHTNIVPIYAQGEHEGLYYYAMELIAGQSVFDIIEDVRSRNHDLRKSRTGSRMEAGDSDETISMPAAAASRLNIGSPSHFNPEDQQALTDSAIAVSTPEYFDNIARLICTVAAALQYAHDAGVIHRDIKPHNLLLGNDGRLCISDFGLARMLEQPGMTLTGEFIGSPLYMSPEQIASGSMRVDHRTDIYSLGATFYEWLTLRPPFPAQSREQVISMIMTVEASPPSTYNPKVPGDLETICLKAIEKNPHDRYQSAGDMADDLRRFLERQRIRARRAGVVVRTRKLVNRHPAIVLLSVLCAVVALSAAVFVNQQSKLRQGQRKLEETRQLLNGGLANNSANGASPAAPNSPGEDTLAGSAAPSAKDILDAQIRERTDFGKAVASLFVGDKASDNQPEVNFGVQLDQFQRYVADRFADAHLASHVAALAMSLNVPRDPGLGPDSAEAQYMMAVLEPPARALELLGQALAVDSKHYKALELRSILLGKLGQFDNMVESTKTLLDTHPDKPMSNVLCGAAHLFQGDVETAKVHLTKAAELGLDYAWQHALLGLCQAHSDRFDFAMQEYNKALELDDSHVVSLFGRGTAQYYQGSYDVALQEANRVVELEPNSPEAFEFRADCYYKLRKYAEASADYFTAIKLGGPFSLSGKLTLASARSVPSSDLDEEVEPAAEFPVPPTEVPIAPSTPAITPQQIQEWFDKPTGGQKNQNQPANPAPGSPHWSGYIPSP